MPISRHYDPRIMPAMRMAHGSLYRHRSLPSSWPSSQIRPERSSASVKSYRSLREYGEQQLTSSFMHLEKLWI
jgi:hypothetical protein